jgi:ribosomal protein S4
MCINKRFRDFKKQKFYSKHRIVSWKLLGKLRLKGGVFNLKGKKNRGRAFRYKKMIRNQKPKWRFLRYSLLNATTLWGRRKKFLGLKNFFKSKEAFRVKPRVSCLKRTYKGSLTEVRKLRLFFGFVKIKVLKNAVLKYVKLRRSREKLLINYLESRLDVLVYRMRFSSSVLESVKKIKKGYVYVNNTPILNRNYQVNSGDKIRLLFNLEKGVVCINKILVLKRSRDKVSSVYKKIPLSGSYKKKFWSKPKSRGYFSSISNIQNKIPSNLEMNYKNLEGIFIRKPLKKELMYPETFCFKTSLRRLEG